MGKVDNSWYYLVGGLEHEWIISPLITINIYMNHGWYTDDNLVGGLEHGFYFSIQLGIVTPTDEVHHFSEGLGSTTKQL